MTGDRWTLLLLRDGRSPIREISVSKRAVHLFVAGSTALVIGLTVAAATLGIDGAAHLRASRLALENQILSQELSSIQARVNGMEGRIGSLSTIDSRLRLLAGLNSIDPEVLQVGIGGPSTSSPQLNSLWPVDSTLSQAAFAVRYDLNVLERKAGLLRESMDEATDSLMAHTDLLESTPSILPTAGIISSPFSKSRYHPIHPVPPPPRRRGHRRRHGDSDLCSRQGHGHQVGVGHGVRSDGRGGPRLRPHDPVRTRLTPAGPRGTAGDAWRRDRSRGEHGHRNLPPPPLRGEGANQARQPTQLRDIRGDSLTDPTIRCPCTTPPPSPISRSMR